jgi:flagellar protein FliO/FliZ
MFESLSEMPNAMKAVAILIFVIVGIVIVGLLLRRFAGDRFGATTARNRQPRLGMVDSVDLPFGRRQLLIVRRDNVEHLVMIGGPTDVVIEQNIVRASGAPREKIEPTLGRGMASETLPRPVPLGEPTPFPLQPQAENNGRTPRIPDEPAQWTWPTQAEPERPPERPARPEPRIDARPAPRSEAINTPSTDFSPRPATPREPSFTRPVTPPVSRPVPTPPTAAPAAATPAPVVTPPAPPAPTPAITPATAPIVKVGIDEKIMANASPDQNLSDMANMLEAALRRPNEPRFTEAPMSMKTEPMAPPAPRFTPPEPKPQAKAEPKPAAPKAVYDSLEEEMASLLGRPPGKP